LSSIRNLNLTIMNLHKIVSALFLMVSAVLLFVSCNTLPSSIQVTPSSNTIEKFDTWKGKLSEGIETEIVNGLLLLEGIDIAGGNDIALYLQSIE